MRHYICLFESVFPSPLDFDCSTNRPFTNGARMSIPPCIDQIKAKHDNRNPTSDPWVNKNMNRQLLNDKYFEHNFNLAVWYWQCHQCYPLDREQKFLIKRRFSFDSGRGFSCKEREQPPLRSKWDLSRVPSLPEMGFNPHVRQGSPQIETGMSRRLLPRHTCHFAYILYDTSGCLKEGKVCAEKFPIDSVQIVSFGKERSSVRSWLDFIVRHNSLLKLNQFSIFSPSL